MRGRMRRGWLGQDGVEREQAEHHRDDAERDDLGDDEDGASHVEPELAQKGHGPDCTALAIRAVLCPREGRVGTAEGGTTGGLARLLRDGTRIALARKMLKRGRPQRA